MSLHVSIRNKLPGEMTLDDIAKISRRATGMLGVARDRMLAPNPRKEAPTYSLAQVATLCGIDKTVAQTMIVAKTHNVPLGRNVGGNRKREFTLVEAREWVNKLLPNFCKPVNADAIKITVGNFKGGVSKTTTAVVLAQGLSLRGKKVLLVDLDPQASATALFGIIADSEVTEEGTILPLIYGSETSLEYAVKSTYWDGIDLIPASTSLFSAEFYLPSKQARDPKFEFWSVIEKGLEPLLKKYDVIIMDTPPALSYLTINAFMAADGLIVPTPPNALDFASSTQFWSLFSDLSSGMQKATNGSLNKVFSFTDVLLTLVDNTEAATTTVRDWINQTYGNLVLPVEIPNTATAKSSAAQFGTAYDVSNYTGSNKTYLRARGAYDEFVALIDEQLETIWTKRVSNGN